MRILACADLHGVPERIARVRDLVREHSPDVLALAGDLAEWGEEAKTLDGLAVLIRVLAVPGNIDGRSLVAELTRRKWLLDGSATVAGVSFGSARTRHTCDVLLSHSPPHGTLDAPLGGEHLGSLQVLELLERLHPRVLLCGQVHECPGVVQFGPTLVVNCSTGADRASGAVVDLTEREVTARLLRPTSV
jgi:hypothetical protein